MINCPCGYGKDITDEQKNCPVCGMELTALHRLNNLWKEFFSKGKDSLKKEDYDNAIESLYTSISMQRIPSEEPFLLLAETFYKTREFDKALEICKRALNIFNENSEFLNIRKNCESELKKENTFKLFNKKNIHILKYAFFILPIVFLFLGIFITNILEKNGPDNFSDAELLSYLQDNLSHQPSLKDQELDVSINNKEISIKGNVQTEGQKDFVYYIANEYNRHHKINVNGIEVIDKQNLNRNKVVNIKYKIRKGDTLTKIALFFYNDSQKWHDIYELNKDIIPDLYKITEGQIIIIPLTQES